MANQNVCRIFVGILATQLVLGCQKPPADDEMPMIPKVDVPASPEHPAELVGVWKEIKGKQTVTLSSDGTCEIKQRVTIGASETKGQAQDFDTKIPCQWGTKDGKFYFSNIAGSPPLEYTYKVAGDKILMDAPGTKLVYTKVVEKPDAKKPAK